MAGGACDGIFDPTRGYVMRGGREMENHFECLWDLFRSIPLPLKYEYGNPASDRL